jgi:DNA polymerase-3 subunit delta
MDPFSFEREIASPDRRAFYVIVGDEPTGLATCLKAAKAAVDPDFFQMNYRQRHAEDLNKAGWGALEGELAAHPFGRPPRVVVVRVGVSDKFPSEAAAELARIKPRINPDATLCVFFDAVPDARLKFFKDAAKEGLEVDCLPPEARDLPRWLIGRFRARGAVLTPEGARAVIERAGTDIGVLEGEAEKLSIFPGGEGPIGPAEAARWVSLSPTAEIYELGGPLGAGRLDQALSTLLDLSSHAAPMSLIYMVGTHFLRLLALQSRLQAAGGRLGDQVLADAASVKPGQLRHLRPQLERWTMGRLKEAMAALEGAHRAMVTSPAGQKIVLEELAVRLGVLAGGGR